MQMVVGLSAPGAEWTRPRTRQDLASKRCVAFDRLAIVEINVTDLIDVRGRPPAVWRRVHAQRMLGRPVATVGRDVDERADRFAETLERRREQGDGAWDVTWKPAQRRCLANVGL